MKTLLVNNKKYRQSTQYMTEEIIEKLQSRGIEVLVDDGSQTISDQELDNIIKARIPNMITLNYRINEQPCVPYKGDGLIFATPAGSTAYSLSAGGPIVDPELEAIIITPVAPYTFSAFGQKPAVIAASKVIRVTPPRFREALISLDGHVTMDFSYNNSIEIKKAHRGLKLANVKKVPFFSTINKRLKRSAGK